MNYARPQIQAMQGYTPGEQPQSLDVIKLNTNENPYPPSPRVAQALASFDPESLRRYPDPVATKLRRVAARRFDVPDERWVLTGNGSDDLLTIALRTFVAPGETVAYPWPTYSLYPILCQIQGATPLAVELDERFEPSADFLEHAEAAKLLFIARPNAPTGNAFPMKRMREFCTGFHGVVWIDEAYAEFADDNCLALVREFDNVVVSRTLSKSASLAGLRLGIALANPALIAEMMKVKDSYNVSMLSQTLATASLEDADYTAECVDKIRTSRAATLEKLREFGFETMPSAANFVFVKPPQPAETYVEHLRSKNIFVRYFPGPRTRDHVRITIGTPEQMQRLFDATARFLDHSSA